MWIHQLLSDLGIDISSSFPMLCNNLATIIISKDNSYHARMKYINIQNHYISEHLASHKATLNHVTFTGDMLKFSDTKVTEYVETMPYFVISFWDKKLTKISFLEIFLETKKMRIYFSSQWFFEPGNWHKPYNCSSIVVTIYLKKTHILRWFLIQEIFKRAEIWIYFLM